MNKLFLIPVFIFSFAFIDANAQTIPKWKLTDLQTAISKADKPTIFNFWATFCKPCVAEIPYFQQLVKKYESEGVQLVLISLDLSEAYPNQISSFASKYKFTSPIKFLAETNADLFCPVVDESWSGAIPASLFVNNKTGYRKFFEEQISKEKLEKEIQLLIKK
jgi:thiol-disulfide isomerase/thioredoxin